MRTAILFTGQVRSLARVASLLRKNLLDPNNVTLFFACEGDSAEILKHLDGYEIGGLDIRSSFRTPEFDAILAMLRGRPGVSEEVFERSRQADNGVPWNIDYVRESGTVVQYYQLWKAYCRLLEYERSHGVRFDACVRARLDMLLTEPIRLESFIGHEFESEAQARSMGSFRIRTLNTRTTPGNYESPWGTPLSPRTVWTLGPEQVWFCSRDLFDVFGPMVFSYGLYDSKKPFSFNSETFFHQTCLQHSIVHYVFQEEGNPAFNYNHPGSDPVVADPWVCTLLR